jgi:hypothetical protein
MHALLEPQHDFFTFASIENYVGDYELNETTSLLLQSKTMLEIVNQDVKIYSDSPSRSREPGARLCTGLLREEASNVCIQYRTLIKESRESRRDDGVTCVEIINK